VHRLFRIDRAPPPTAPPPSLPPSPPAPQGDACALPSGLGTFDAVLAANLLCRVPSPMACLQEIDRSLNPGGVLALTSPFTWLDEYTDRAKWLGGRRDGLGPDGRPLRCADALKATLAGMGYTVLEEGKVRGRPGARHGRLDCRLACASPGRSTCGP
jgi:SAM-dependent methyltransferase